MLTIQEISKWEQSVDTMDVKWYESIVTTIINTCSFVIYIQYHVNYNNNVHVLYMNNEITCTRSTCTV